MAKKSIARSLFAVTGAALLLLVSTVPANARATWNKTLTCNNYGAYSTVVAGSAQGLVYHYLLQGGYVVDSLYMGNSRSFTYSANNTHIGGTSVARVYAGDWPNVVQGAISSNTSYCTTY